MVEPNLLERPTSDQAKVGVIWVMESGAFKATSYDLFLKTDKIVAARLCTHHGPVYSTFVRRGNGATIAFGAVAGGITGAAVAGIAVRNRTRTLERAREVAGSSTEELLGNEDTFVIDKSEIKEAKLAQKGFLQKIMTLELRTNQKKYHWQVMGVPGLEGAKIEDVERLLKSALPTIHVKN